MHVKLRVFCSAWTHACMRAHVCVPREGHSSGESGKHRPAARQGWWNVCFFVLCREVLGKANAACPDGCMQAYGCATAWRGGCMRCMCSVGTAGVRVARFQGLNFNGGHVELTWRVELWIGEEARRLGGEWKEEESGLGVIDVGVEYLRKVQYSSTRVEV